MSGDWKTWLPPAHRAQATGLTDWREAVRRAAGVLVDEGAIDAAYVDAMIQSVETYGPYIVLDEGFALPHAKAEGHVHRVAMSLLQVAPAVDLEGRPVDVFLVLAAPDATSHLEALAALGALLGDDASRDVLRFGSPAEIEALLAAE
ncbi:MAG: PTS sugar transporter subunit IIA [Peptoniphilaceae bacterium]|nr:PTS sugar transporter subunit IIA [Peptoniphilaceae bacterium]MDY6085766.1 PTS sugar transporter subunit IIA [Peptoniphilaceae bacterium]